VHWLLLVILGCGGRAKIGAEGPEPVRYRISLHGDFGAVTDPESGEVLQEDTDAELSLSLSVSPVRRFRDGSMGQRVVVEESALSVDGAAYEGLELTGRSLELRTFSDGEILTLGWVDRWSGPDRFMDVFEVVFPAISPAPPSLKKGETASRRIIWPYLGEERLRWDSAVDAKWTNKGVVERGAAKAWHLSYEGPWRVHGGRRTGDEKFKVSASGDADGQVWFDKATGALVSHRFAWSREVEVSGAAARLKQAQAFVGSVERQP